MPTWADGVAWLLASTRALGLLVVATPFTVPGVTWRVRILLALVLGTVTAPAARGLAIPAGDSWEILLAGLGELWAGATLGLATGLVISAARQAGDWIATQAGLTPDAWLGQEHGEVTPLGSLYAWIALLTFVALDGPLVWVRGLIGSYAGGTPAFGPGALQAIAGRIGESLALAIRLAAPAGLALIASGLALGLLGRSAPSVSALALTMPVRFIVGGALVVAGLGMTAWVISEAFRAI
jgi:flagellar biosynthetic protein FliR